MVLAIIGPNWEMVPQERIELSASPLPRVRSTPELLRRLALISTAMGSELHGPMPAMHPAQITIDGSGANLPQAAFPSKRFCPASPYRCVAGRGEIGHQIAMKSDKKNASPSAASGGQPDRLKREAAALRANLRRRKQQQQERQAQDRQEERPEDKDDS